MARLNIDPTTWAILDRLLDEALELEPSERPTWLDNLPAEHAPLKARLASLLSRDNEGLDEQERFATIPKLSKATRSATRSPGAIVGPYELVQLLGEGGMGTVWLAQRTDGMLDRPVALKLPHRSSARPDLVERMTRERQILATLAHPNIARIYDAGLDDDGQPYLALEYIEGIPIHEYAVENELDVRARIELVIKIAHAVAHAHGRLVVHRDIKPSNILVTADGEPHLLDFGIAKLLEGGRTHESNLTLGMGRAMTLGYASPEQIRGEPLSVASDVYSLGVVLFRILSGGSPYQLERDSAGALEQAVLEQPPIRPSNAAPPALRPSLRGDLDNIVLKALKKDPVERYPTTDAFRADLERHLTGHPVLARPDQPLYRAQKFVGRNRLAVTVAASALVAILTIAGIAIWQARVAIRERARAEEVTAFATSVFRDANPETGDGQPLSAVDLLLQAGDRIDERLTTPEVRAELLQLLSSSLVHLHDTTATEKIARRTVAETSALYGPTHASTLRARLTLAWALLEQGKTDDAHAELDDVIPALERNTSQTPTDLIEALRLRGHLAIRVADYAGAAAAASRAVDLGAAIGRAADEQVLLALIVLARAHSFADRHAEALDAMKRAERLAERLFPGNTKHPHVMSLRVVYGTVLGRSGDPEGAITQIQRVLRDRSHLFGPSSVPVGELHNNLVNMYLWAGRVSEAIRSSERAYAVLSAKSKPGSYSAIAAANSRAKALLAARRGEEALPFLTTVSDGASQLFGPLHPHTIDAHARYALALGYAGRLDEARSRVTSLISNLRETNAPLGQAQMVAGIVEELAGENTTAIALLEEARHALSRDRRAHRLASVALGRLLVETGEVDRGGALLEEAVRTLDSERTIVSPDHADALVGLGRLRLAQGRHEDAIELLGRARDSWRVLDPNGVWAAEADAWYARCQIGVGANDARDNLARATAVLKKSPFVPHQKLATGRSPGDRSTPNQ